MFDRLIWTVMGFGADIWGERERIDRIEERYLRWGAGGGWKNARVSSERGIAKGGFKEKSGKEGMRV